MAKITAHLRHPHTKGKSHEVAEISAYDLEFFRSSFHFSSLLCYRAHVCLQSKYIPFVKHLGASSLISSPVGSQLHGCLNGGGWKCGVVQHFPTNIQGG